MKILVNSLFMAFLIACNNLTTVSAQQMPTLPIDPNVRIGTLDNGLTYYIRRNNLPEQRVDFYLAIKAGSILEEPGQRGLAHFLEHMSFNGSKHFPGDGVKQYLETIGVKFGHNLNAGTGVESTTYQITDVPATRESIVDSCLLILRDWANDLTLDKVEIDKERGVINEEWRSRMSSIQRLQEKALPQMYPGSKYADCLPIGSMDVVNNAKPQALRDYYEKWYRPDLQGIVVVGDIDVDSMESKIKAMFADIPAKPDAAERIYYPVSDNVDPIVVIEQDKEQTNIEVLIFNKHETTPREEKGTMAYLAVQYAKSMIAGMLGARLDEIRQTPNPPFIAAAAYDNYFFASKTKDAFTGVAICKEGEIETGFAALLREIERARRFGFTDSEYRRARAEYLRHLESEYNERDKKKNNYYAAQYVSSFLDNEPIAGIENEYGLINQIAPSIPVEALNQIMNSIISDNNKVVAVFGPEKEGIQYPTKERIIELMKEITAEELLPYEDKVSDEPLISQLPAPGSIISQTYDETFGTTNMTLSNGAKVIIKQTDFKADQIHMKGVSLGGSSLFPDSEIINILNINSVVGIGGLGNFSKVDLDKVLAGKRASVNAVIGNKTEGITGSCSPKDFETMMQLTYLSFTSQRKDEDAFASFKNRAKATLQNQELDPMSAFMDSILSTIYMNHPRTMRLKSDMVDRIDYDRILEMYKDRFMDAGDFTFIFVGNIVPEEAKPFIEQYIASLPSTGRKETFADNKIGIRKGIYKNVFYKEQETKKATVLAIYSGNCTYNLKNNIMLSMLNQVLNMVYLEKVREDEGGTYSVNVGGTLTKYPKEEFNIQIMFETEPAKKNKLMEIIHNELDVIAQEGPSGENLNKVKEFMLKEHTSDLKENAYWLEAIDEYLFTGMDTVNEAESIISSITVDDIRRFANELFSQKNELEVTMVTPDKE